jgi:hypothetical protein
MMRGLTGVIEMASGNLDIKPWEDIDVEPHGCTIHHNDLYDTKTFIPVFTIKMIRWHEKSKEKAGQNVSGEELARRTSSPVGMNEAIEMTRRAIEAASEEE